MGRRAQREEPHLLLQKGEAENCGRATNILSTDIERSAEITA